MESLCVSHGRNLLHDKGLLLSKWSDNTHGRRRAKGGQTSQFLHNTFVLCGIHVLPYFTAAVILNCSEPDDIIDG